MARIYRYEVPVDDRWHEVALYGDPIHVDCRQLNIVEFWAIHCEARDSVPTWTRSFMVVGTGHELPPDYWRTWGSVIAPGGLLVWHLIERRMP